MHLFRIPYKIIKLKYTDFLVFRDYKLKSILVQTRRNANEVKYISAIVKSGSDIYNFSDLRGKRACFTSIDGVGKY